ncbi:MAG TPA: hypothetical protein PLZ08_07095 [Bacillota bacterium]|jgi:hypothetical protein|nr:hypothetical protein [Bacillota bacterium]HOL09834.1 hypothetical protein [Bacillota bacterium]HPO97711.1 hypothetical protein [Bacillota bacterium]
MRKIYGIFQNLNDAKIAIGKIKVTAWNRARITLICPETNQDTQDNYYEFGCANFIANTMPVLSNWNGFKEQEIPGVGKVKVATIDHRINQHDLSFLRRAISEQKVSVVIEVEPELSDKVHYLLENQGADVLVTNTKAKDTITNQGKT